MGMKELFDLGFFLICISVAIFFGGVMGREVMLMEYDKEVKHLYAVMDGKFPACVREAMYESP
jgi:hypothetical protein